MIHDKVQHVNITVIILTNFFKRGVCLKTSQVYLYDDNVY